MKKSNLKFGFLIVTALTLHSCSVFYSSGDAIESVGEGVGDAVVGTGRAVGDGLSTVVEGTGNAIKSGADSVEKKGY